MALPGQMFDHMLNPAKGWPSQSALDCTARISANVLYDLVAGQVCHLNAQGEIEPGVISTQMGLFIFQGKNDLDVNNQGNDQWIPVSPTGKVMALVATGAFELETTEFDATQVYARNQLLRAPVGNGVNDYVALGSGRLTNQGVTLYTTAVCGVVSRGVFKNNYGKNVLAYWPVYLPGTTNA